jgi:hypothetical protein
MIKQGGGHKRQCKQFSRHGSFVGQRIPFEKTIVTDVSEQGLGFTKNWFLMPKSGSINASIVFLGQTLSRIRNLTESLPTGFAILLTDYG